MMYDSRNIEVVGTKGGLVFRRICRSGGSSLFYKIHDALCTVLYGMEDIHDAEATIFERGMRLE